MESNKNNKLTPEIPRQELNLRNLMPYRVHEILLIASPYDAYILEEDGVFSEKFLGYLSVCNWIQFPVSSVLIRPRKRWR